MTNEIKSGVEEMNEKIQKYKNEIIKYINEYFEPFLLKGKVNLQTINDYAFDTIWFFYKEEAISFEFSRSSQEVKTCVYFYKGNRLIFIIENEGNLETLFDTIKKKMKRYFLSDLYER